MNRLALIAGGILLLGGCVERTMTIKSDPPGALVYLNDQEVGRTPITRDFVWYGDYQVEVRKEGYETLKTHKWVKAPGYLWVPFDFFVELSPFMVKDHHDMAFALKPQSAEAAEPGPLMSRAEELKGKLESSEHTRAPTTHPAPTTRKSKATPP
jgi:hypothetical protein